MLFQPVKKAQHRQFEFKARHVKEKQKERNISFREQHIFDTTDANLAGKLREYTHIKRPKNSPTLRYVRLMLLLAIFGVVYFIYSDKFALFGDEIVKVTIGCFVLIILIILFINHSNKK